MLASERLRLEPLSVRHAAEFAAYRRRNRVYLTPWEPMGPEASFTEAYQVTAIARIADDRQQVNFVLFEIGGDRLIGECNLFNIRRGIVQAAIIGYSVDEAHAGRGYASEAAGMVVRYAF